MNSHPMQSFHLFQNILCEIAHILICSMTCLMGRIFPVSSSNAAIMGSADLSP